MLRIFESIGGKGLLLLFVMVLAGCAGGPRMTPAQEQQLLARAAARWEAIAARDFDAAYAFTSPAYREVFSNSLYRKKFSYMVEWRLTGVELVAYDARAAVASVAARVMSKPAKPTSAASAAIGAVPTTRREQWIHADGQWWYSTSL